MAQDGHRRKAGIWDGIPPEVMNSTSREGSTHPSKPGSSKAKKVKRFNDYFFGPRDPSSHSKWPFFFRLHGSMLPDMILPMLIVGIWVTAVTVACKLKFKDHKFDPVLLTVLGFVVALALSFRSNTAYERYNEGRKYWAQLTLTSQNLARIVWVHAREREGEQGKEDLLAKITCLNLIVAFSIALKHKLRFEPYVEYDDIRGYVEYLDTFAKEANKGLDVRLQPVPIWKRIGGFLNVSFAQSNPRRAIKDATRPLGNLPLEILSHLQGYMDSIIDNGTLKAPIYQVQSISSITILNDILTGTDRILNTPLPLAWSIAISQITWIYILILPLQLYARLGWGTIPGTLLAAYIILGLALVGTQIENPFGHEVNDLPLESFCEQIANDIDIVASLPPPKAAKFMKTSENMPLYPLSRYGYDVWLSKSEDEIRDALKAKVGMRFDYNHGITSDDQIVLKTVEFVTKGSISRV